MQDAPKKRRKRPPLSPEGIETAALALINREGLAGFSMRKLGAELGCEAMSLYHYFPSTGHLMDALIDRIARQYLPMPAASLPWRERLRAFCIRWRAVALANPGFFGFLATHRMNTPTALRAIDGVIALIREGTASDEEAARL
ncbi:MAG: TetR family transcriptional regulator, partial [Rhodobacteraceae bacterium]|nr:TetR family transcriptional regulator [Paracoccaceae bacterium]